DTYDDVVTTEDELTFNESQMLSLISFEDGVDYSSLFSQEKFANIGISLPRIIVLIPGLAELFSNNSGGVSVAELLKYVLNAQHGKNNNSLDPAQVERLQGTLADPNATSAE